jgi:hypothetical protein
MDEVQCVHPPYLLVCVVLPAVLDAVVSILFPLLLANAIRSVDHDTRHNLAQKSVNVMTEMW